jgi:uncharacterized protein (DUF302 family)
MIGSTTTHYTVSTQKDVEGAMQALEAALKSRQFSVLWHLDINQKLVEKGLEPGPPFHVLEVCSAPRAKEALTANQQVGYFLPCKMVVYKDHDKGETQIGLLRPGLMMELLGDERLEPLAAEVEGLLKEAAAAAAG